jgi:drug/metabolite transporter (DMT)-like permease
VPAERLGLFLYMIPAVSIVGGVRFLDESLTVQILLGCALTVFGVWVASRPDPLSPAAVTE